MKKLGILVLFVFLLTHFGYAQDSDTLVCRKRLFISSPVPEQVKERMIGKSMPKTMPISFEELRYLILPYFDFDGNVQTGEMVCHKSIAKDLLFVFRTLFRLGYPIYSIRLVDDFDGNDEASMQANNTSCFNYRTIMGTNILSNHAFGMAVDVNPLQNPWVRNGLVNPTNAIPYVDRSRDFLHKIDRKDACYIIFKTKGFTWGGDWSPSKDYQHFQKLVGRRSRKPLVVE